MREVKLLTKDNDYTIQIIKGDGDNEFSRPEEDLWTEINKVQRFSNKMYAEKTERKKTLFSAIYHAADMGLRKKEIQTGWSNLNEAKALIAEDYPITKNTIWKKYATGASIGLLLLMPLGGAVYIAQDMNLLHLTSEQIAKVNFLYVIAQLMIWVPAGVLLGIFMEFLVTVGDKFDYDSIVNFNPAKWSPLQNIINTILVAYIFTFLLKIKLVQVGLAGYMLNDFKDNTLLCPIIGFLSGVAYTFVKDLTYKLQPSKK